MKLSTRAALAGLVPFAAVILAACGDSGTPTTPTLEDAEPVLTPAEEAAAAAESVCGDTFITHEEECESGPNCTDQCMDNECGDGFEGPGEACDDGNTRSGDGCQSDCKDPRCGDGTVDDGEACDDMNRVNDDGCTNTCEEPSCGDGIVQADSEECDEGEENGNQGSNCTATCNENACRDGHLGPGEACDDMNDTDGDGCTNACGLPTCGDGVVQEGEECDDGNTNDRDECLTSCVVNACGDGFVLAGEEECDDGNTSNNDACLNTCVGVSCGDGFVGPGEGCDEGEDNAVDGDCSTACIPKDCGDGEVQPGEECDDGNTANNDACSNSCVTGRCGDGVRQEDEECDDGNTSNNDACLNTCVHNECGDGFVGPLESCDDGNQVDGDGCQANCSEPSCGDGIVDDGEQCDDGQNGVDTDSCLDTCQWNSCGDGASYTEVTDDGNANALHECDDGNTVEGDLCTNACANAECGDGIVGPGEGCDDQNTTDGDGCNGCVPPDCGNGVLDPDELCDDGNAVETDACLSSCAPASCGDGMVQAGIEGCDDQNTSNADACLTTCVPASCGDGFLRIGVEECDLGAINGPGSQCSTSCTVSNCGDGRLDPGEECDDGNNNSNDSCLHNCVWNRCGDGAVYIQVTDNANTSALEECDDANADQSDLCLASCRYSRCSDGTLLTNNESEPYADPDGTGIRTASRGGANDPYHSSGEDPDNLTPPVLTDLFGGTCDEGESCIPGYLSTAGVVPSGSGLSTVNIFFIDEEECDDGNLTNTDACLARNEDGDPEYECRTAYCNDGAVQAGVEQCDDGCGPLVAEVDCVALRDQTDSCLDTCVRNSCGDGWLYITNTAGTPTPPLESCDDGNTAAGDACSPTCTTPACGNGVRDFSILEDGMLRLEECDNGGSNSNTLGSTCSTTCTLRSATTGAETCGNLSLDAGEDCDDGNTNENDSCLSNCQFNECGDGARYVAQSDTNGPVNPNRLEQCDDANDNNNDSCVNTCAWNTCGDNAEYRKETDGDPALGGPAQGNGLLSGCDNTDDPFNDTSESLYNDCDAPDTGGEDNDTGAPDGSLIPEDCDDGNAVNDDTCSNRCEAARCGDGILQAGELCDDGNTTSTDECLSYDGDEFDLAAYCAVTCGPVPAAPVIAEECYENCLELAQSCTPNVCGDGFKGPFEACDDGNTVDTDACRNDCSVSSCGNAVFDGAPEECDDGNSNSSDNCTDLCLLPRCGDGILQPSNLEQCDDGNNDNTDACTSSCRVAVCGDGVRQGTEQCDPGRLSLDGVDNDELAEGTYLYPNHDDVFLSGPAESLLSHEDRDDGYVDEPFFCDPNSCQIRCNGAQGTHGRRWKDNNQWCVFAAESPGLLNDAMLYDDAARGSYTVYNETGWFEPERDLSGWDAARSHCASYGIGADLVVIRNVEENQQLLTLVDAAWGYYFPSLPGAAGLVEEFGLPGWYFWTGLNDVGAPAQEPNGSWRWLDGAPTDTFRNWGGPPATPQRPDDAGGDEDCAAIATTNFAVEPFRFYDYEENPGTWNDLVCQYPLDVMFVCEFQLPAAPQ